MPKDQELQLEECVAAGVRLFIRRYDLLHPEISGNKQFKLKYWLEEKKEGQRIVSFGGAYSNHLLALSAAGKSFNFKTTGIIRGERPGQLSSWLMKMQENGMELKFISREDYREKDDPGFLVNLEKNCGDCLLIPEGGAGIPGIKGAMEMVMENEPYSSIILPAGTGTTLAGIAIKTKASGIKITGIQVLKGSNIIRNELLKNDINIDDFPDVIIDGENHFGGYGKTTSELDEFRKRWFSLTGITIDRVYMGKTAFALLQKIKAGFFKKGSRILLLHTGGNGPAADQQQKFNLLPGD